MKLHLYFRGRLSPGVTRAHAAKLLSRMVKQPPDVVERRLFTGKPVKLKTVRSQEDADRFAKAFEKAGLIVEVRSESGDTQTGSAKAASADAPAQRETAGGRRTRTFNGRIAALVAVLSVAGILAVGAWYTQPIWRAGVASEETRSVARALATGDLVLLARIDVDRGIELKERLFGGGDPDALLSPDDDTWDSLAKAGIDVGEQVDDVLVAFHSDGERSDWTVVALGSFDTDSVRRWISGRYDVERFDQSTGTLYFNWLDRTTCEPVSLKAVRVGRERLLMTTAERIDEFWSRLRQSAPEAPPVVDEWLSLSEKELLSLGVFTPASIGQAANGMAGMMLAAAGQAASPAEMLHFGASPTLMPPGVELIGTITSEDATFLDGAHAAASSWLSGALESARSESPQLVAMYDRISVARAGKAFRAGVRLDTDIDDEMAKLTSAVLGRAFKISPGEAGGFSMPPEEQLRESPVRFANATPQQLLPFASFGDAFFRPQWQQGPFALAVSRLEVDGHGALLVSLRGQGRGLPNLGERSKLVRLNITDVVDADGRTLLPVQECGPTRNRGWTDDSQVSRESRFEGTEIVYLPTVSLDRQLRLAPGMKARDVAAIRGELEFLLPAEVRSVTVPAPLADQVVSGEDIRLRFQPGSDTAIAYQVSGDARRLLAVRALNAQGQVLESGSSSWSDSWFGSGESASVEFYGQVAAAEVVLADRLEPIRFAFELTSVYPNVSDRTAMQRPLPSVASPDSLSDIFEAPPPEVTFDFMQPMATTTAGPSTVIMERLQVSPFMGLYAEMQIYVPNQFPLAGQLNGVTILLDRIDLPDGTSVDLGLAAPTSLGADGGYWMNGEFRYDEERPWLKGSVGLQAADYDNEMPGTVHGRTVLRAVEDTTTIEVSPEPGSRMRQHGVDVVVSEWQENTLYLSVIEGVNRIVSVTAVDADGGPAGRAEKLSQSGDETRINIDLTAIPETLQVVAATEIREFETPFTMTLEP